MKYMYAILASLFMVIGNAGFAQDPFQVNPTNSSGLFFGQVLINDFAPTENDWIAALDAEGNVAGAAKLIANQGNLFINLPIYGDDPTTTDVDEGMNGGENFSLQLYDASRDVYINYRDADTTLQFNQWTNTNGTPMPAYGNPQTVFKFWKADFDQNSLVAVCADTSPFELQGGAPAGGLYAGQGVSEGSTFVPTDVSPGMVEIAYVFTSPDGTKDTATAEQIINDLPVVSLPLLDPACLGQEAFTLTGGSPVGGFFEGPGVFDNKFKPEDAGEGTHEIIYTYTDANGCKASATNNIRVGEKPVANFEVEQEGLALSFTTSTLDFGVMNWDFGDGNNSTETNPTHTYSASGMYEVSLVVSNFCGADTFTQSFTVIATSRTPLPDLSALAIYPNPNNGQFQILIQTEASKTLEITLLNLVGKPLLQQKHQLLAGRSNLRLDMGEIPSGIYMMRVSDRKKTAIKKFTVLR